MSLEMLVRKVLGRFQKDPHGSRTARIALRRMRVGTTPPLAAMALAVEHGATIDGPTEQSELLFGALQLTALLADQHDGSAWAGESLYKANVSEPRLERLLRARPDQLPHQLKAVARQLMAKGTKVNVVRLAELLWRDDDAPRLSIAQSFYRAAAQGDRE